MNTMTFAEASAVARVNPGSVLKRLPDGKFGVVLPDGSWACTNNSLTKSQPEKVLEAQIKDQVLNFDSQSLNVEVESKVRDRTRDLLQQIGMLKEENDRLLARLNKASSTMAQVSDENILLKASLKERQIQLDVVVRPLEKKIASLETIIADKEKEIIEWSNKNKRLKDKIDLVSKDELVMIEHRLQNEANTKLLARIVTKCSCHGEVENCYRCDGKGEYIVDGNGNRCI